MEISTREQRSYWPICDNNSAYKNLTYFALRSESANFIKRPLKNLWNSFQDVTSYQWTNIGGRVV